MNKTGERRSLLGSDRSGRSGSIGASKTEESSRRTEKSHLLQPKSDTGTAFTEDGSVKRPPPSAAAAAAGDSGDPKTDWNAVIMCAVVYLIITTILQALNVVCFMYLEKIDPTITPVYGGLHMASTKTGHALGTIVFAVWAYSTKKFKTPLLVGRAASILSIVLYLSILLFPERSRRYVFLIAFFCQSVAEGSLIVVRSYIPRVSSRADRGAAYGIISGGMMMSILAGPGIQIACGALPKAEIFAWLHLNSFTYPVWISLLLCIIATALIALKITEPAPLPEEESVVGGSLSDMLATALRQLENMDKVAIFALFFEKIIASFCFSTLISLFTTFMNTILNKPEKVTLMYIAASQSAVGTIAILTASVFIFTPAKNMRISTLLFFAQACYFVVYFGSYPWPPISEPYVVKNVTNPDAAHGCDTEKLAWCEWQLHVKPWYWMPFVCITYALAVPTSMISLDTVYSKLVGNIDQNLMQGAFMLIDDLAGSVGPVVFMKIYTVYGPALVWLLVSGSAAVGFVTWLTMIPKMRRLNV